MAVHINFADGVFGRLLFCGVGGEWAGINNYRK